MDRIYSIREVAELFNITTNKIRFYEKKGLLKPLRHNDYRKFDNEDILQKVYELSVSLHRDEPRILEIGGGTGNLASKFLDEDEYYSKIDFLEKEFNIYNKSLTYNRIDMFNYVVQIN